LYSLKITSSIYFMEELKRKQGNSAQGRQASNCGPSQFEEKTDMF